MNGERKIIMAKYRKLGRTSAQRKALLRNQVTAVINNGKIVTTEAKAKEVQKIVDGLIALAVKEKDNFETVKVTTKVARKDKDGNFIWPGFGDNMRVLDWILRRAKGKAEGQKTVLGVSPTYDELDKTGIDYSEEQFNANMALNPSEWKAELESQTELFDKVGKKLPAELEEQRQILIKSFS